MSPALTPLSESSETLSAIDELDPRMVFPSSAAYPSSTLYPGSPLGLYRQFVLAEDTQTLTPVTES